MKKVFIVAMLLGVAACVEKPATGVPVGGTKDTVVTDTIPDCAKLKVNPCTFAPALDSAVVVTDSLVP